MEMLLLTYKLDFLCHSLLRHFQFIVSKCSLKLLEKTFTSSLFTYNGHKWKRHSLEPFDCSFHVGKPAHSPDLPQQKSSFRASPASPAAKTHIQPLARPYLCKAFHWELKTLRSFPHFLHSVNSLLASEVCDFRIQGLRFIFSLCCYTILWYHQLRTTALQHYSPLEACNKLTCLPSSTRGLSFIRRERTEVGKQVLLCISYNKDPGVKRS